MTLRTRLFGGDRRTALIKKNIAGSMAIKVWSCVVQLWIVPMTLGCLTQYEYGIWLTLNAILMGIDAIDVGLGNGLRNKLAEALATNNRLQARRYVSTTFVMLITVIVPVILLVIALIAVVDCHRLLNVDPTLVPNLRLVLTLAFALMGSAFIFKFIGNMYMGLQLPVANNLLVVAGQTLALAIIWLLMRSNCGTLATVVAAYTGAPLLVYLLAWPITFCGRYRYLAPSLHMVTPSAFSELFSMGVKFFLIQVAGMMLLWASNLIIQTQISPEAVTPYQLTYRYFSLLFVVFSIIVQPLWSATTDAYARGDWHWIHHTLRRMHLLLLLCAAGAVLMIPLQPLFFHFWVDDQVAVPLSLSMLCALYIWLQAFSNAYSYILMGIGKIRLITLVNILGLCLFLPLEWMVCRWWASEGVLLTLCLSTIVYGLLNRAQLHKISQGTASGIWNQ